MRATLATGALLFLLLPPGLAATPALDGSAGSLTASSPFLAAGALRNLEITQCDQLAIRGTASIEGRIEESRYRFAGPAGLGAPETNELPLSSEHAVLEVVAETDCRIFVLSSGRGAVVAGKAGAALPTSEDRFVARRGWVNAPAFELDRTNALSATLANHVSLTGDAMIVVWASEIRLREGDTTRTAWTGFREMRDVPSVPAGYSVQREAVLQLYDANVTIWGVTSAALNDLDVQHREGTLVLADATLAGLAGGEVVLAPPATMSLSSEKNMLRIAGLQAEAITVDGAVVGFPASTSPGWMAWLWLLLLFPLAAGELVRRDLAVRRQMRRRNYARVPRLARSIAWMPLLGRRAQLAYAVSLLHTQHYAEARRLLTPARPWRSMEPTWHYLWAHLSAATGEPEAAEENLADCLALEPAYLADAQSDPILRPIVESALRRAERRRSRPVEGYS
jgi:hypothetical protein